MNISTGIRTTVQDLIDTIVLNLPYDVSVEFTGSTPGDQHGITGDISYANEILKWKPGFLLKDGIKIMVDWVMKLNNDD